MSLPSVLSAMTTAPLLIAHRGHSSLYPENSLQSFVSALELAQVDGIEMDVARSADGQYFILHDDTLDRTMKVDGLDQTIIDAVKGVDVSELEWSLISQIPVDDNLDACPLARDAIELAKEYNKHAVVEFKSSNLKEDEVEEYVSSFAESMGNLLEKPEDPHMWDSTEKVIFISFELETARVVKETFPDHTFLYLMSFMDGTCDPACDTWDETIQALDRIQSYKFDGLQTDLYAFQKFPQLRDEISRRGLVTGVWVSAPTPEDGNPIPTGDRSIEEHQFMHNNYFEFFTSNIPAFVTETDIWKPKSY